MPTHASDMALPRPHLSAAVGHWPEYLGEAAGLGLFMISACAFGTLLGHPGSPAVRALPNPGLLRGLMGLAMGLTAVALIRSPWGQRSGAHFNPATTLTFWRLHKVAAADALFYALAQVGGGLAGTAVAGAILGELAAHPAVQYVISRPGAAGAVAAFAAEVVIAFVLMSVMLAVSNTPRLARFTPLCVGALVALYITVEAPISGMSMNPARSLASAWAAGTWESLWIYFIAPPLGMGLAAEVYVRRRGVDRVFCAKLDHDHARRCIFRCRHAELGAGRRPPISPSSAPAILERI